MVTVLAVVAALLTGFSPLSVQAAAPQDPEEASKRRRDLTRLSLEELLQIEVDEVYSASRYVQKISQAPSSVTVVTADEIRKYGHRTLGEVLRSVRGTYVSSDRNYAYLGMRGFGLPADYNNRLLALVDGHRVNDGIGEGVSFDEGFVVDVDDIERVEVVRGPASSLYGSNAFFGVVNVMTRKGRSLNGPEASASATSFAAYEVRGSYGALYEEGPEVYVSGTLYDSLGATHHFPEFDAPATNNGYAPDADGETAYHALAKVAWKGLSFQAIVSDRKKVIPTAPYGTDFPSRDTMTWDGGVFTQLRFDHDFPGQFHLQAKASFNRTWYYGDYEYGGVINKDTADVDVLGGEIVAAKDFADDRLRISAGVEARDYLRQDQRNFDDVSPEVEYLASSEDSTVAAAFVQADVLILDPLRLNAGARLDDYSTFGSSFNPRSGLIWAADEATVVKALYGRAFRAPSPYELHYAVPTQKANPDLDPETIDTYEVSVERSLGGGFEVFAAGFHYRCEDLINLVVDPSDGIRVFRNEAEVRTTGAELELRARLGNGLEGRASWTLQEARNVEGDQWLPNSPRNLGKLAVSAPIALEKVFAGLELFYVGERASLAGRTIDDYFLANLTISAREIAQGLDFSASIYNLFDEEYFDPGGTEHVQDQLKQDGIAFRFKLTYRF
jgi:iron complex outermembrane receptor protein